jgi:hypothetical protein
MKSRGLFATEAPEALNSHQPGSPRNGQGELLWGPLRRNFFDRFGRR